MVQDAASRAFSRSSDKQRGFLALYGVICAAILAGFEGYGSAMAGMGPSGSAIDNLEARGEECAAPKALNALTCSHPVAEVRSCGRSDASTGWRYARVF